MKTYFCDSNFTVALRLTVTIITSLLLLNSCKNKTPDTTSDQDASVSVPTLQHNNLGQALNPSSFLLEQAHSPVHWQPWSKEIFADAAKEKKTIFAFIGSSTNSHSLEILKEINASPSISATLNKSHVNVLVDADQHPELSFLIAALSSQIRSTVAHTQLIWFSYEGLPISWTGVTKSNQLNINTVLKRMSKTVIHLWQNDPSYVLKNSRSDIKMRLDSINPKKREEQDPLTSFRATRQAASLFDPVSNSIDHLSGLSASRYIRLMAIAASHPDTSEQQKKNYTRVATLAANNILLQGLIDPLDGGIFVGTQKSAGKLPIFTKSLSAQTQSIAAFYSLYQLTSDKAYLTAAENISNYIESTLALPDGGYSLGIIYAGYGLLDNPCIWTLEEIEAALNEEEAQLCIQAFGISGTGNIPLTDVSNRTYFRKNTLIWKTSPEELAKQNALSPAELKLKLSSITKKLAKIRTEKTKQQSQNKLTTVNNHAELASAHLVGYRATGDRTKLEKARQILNFVRSDFMTQSGELRRCRFQGKLQSLPATSSDYARVCSAALDMHEVTLDSAWLDFAAQIHQQMNSALTDSEFTYLSETDASNHSLPFKIQKFITIKEINNESSWALVYANAKRLNIRGKGEEYSLQAANIKAKINHIGSMAPLANIDLLTETSLLERKVVYLKAPADKTLLNAALPLHCQLILVTNDGTYPGASEIKASLEAGQALVMERDKVIGTAKDRETLSQMLR